jgi:alanyl-tRNA synthetase
MSTHRLYYDDSYLQNFDARILECIPAPPLATAAGTVPAWEVVLDRTAFYPTSGGQPHDLGKIQEAHVLDVRDEGDEIVHIVDEDLAPGPIRGCIDWPRRFDHMQQHTGQHLLSAMFQERYGLPTVSFHLGVDICTIDLRGPEPKAEVLVGAQRAANNVIFEDRPITMRYGTAEQLAAQGVRKEVDRTGILRAVEIEAADLQPCGGTHVKSCGQIGLILVRRCTKIRQDWRVEFVCGGRAARHATHDFHLLRQIAEQWSCAPEEVPATAEKAKSERDGQFKVLKEVVQQLAVLWAKELASNAELKADGLRVVSVALRPENPEPLLLPLATELAKNEKLVALVAHQESGQFVFAQHPGAGKDLAAMLKQLLAQVPGKGGGTRDFVRAKLASPAQCAELLSVAKALLAQ